MKTNLLSILLIVSLGCLYTAYGDACDGFTGYDQICNNQPGDFHDLVDGSVVESETACQVIVSTSGGTCQTYCENQGSVCVAAQDNTGNSCNLDARHERRTTEENGCLQTWGNQLCVCDEPVQEEEEQAEGAQEGSEDPCQNFTGYDMVCENGPDDFSSLVDGSVVSSPTACQVMVPTSGGNCQTYCESQGSVCVAAQDNAGSDCVLYDGHDRQTTEENGCLQTWGNQVCICDEATPEEPAQEVDEDDDDGAEQDEGAQEGAQEGSEDPCQDFTGYDLVCDNGPNDFSTLVDASVVSSHTACQVMVPTSGSTCAQYCESQGSVCVAAQDNATDDCTLYDGHDRQTTEENGCQQSWGNQVCVCDIASEQVVEEEHDHDDDDHEVAEEEEHDHDHEVVEEEEHDHDHEDDDHEVVEEEHDHDHEDDDDDDDHDHEDDDDDCGEPRCAILYSECNYEGESLEICEDTPNFRIEEWDHQTRSIYIPDGVELTLYTCANFEGEDRTFDESADCLESGPYVSLLKKSVSKSSEASFHLRKNK